MRDGALFHIRRKANISLSFFFSWKVIPATKRSEGSAGLLTFAKKSDIIRLSHKFALNNGRVCMGKYDLFWETMELCDWDHEGDDDRVLLPVIQYLSAKDDSAIFEFEDQMSELLFALDTKWLAMQCESICGYWGEDDFLYSRCVALVNGETFYNEVLSGEQEVIWNMEFESLLYVSARAWAIKHQREESEFPYCSPVSYETGSNVDAWS